MNLLYANDRPGEYPASYYAATRAELAPQPALQGECRADVCVIGAGYTGLSAALHLAQAGRRVVVLEAHRVGFGASGRNGGQVGSGQRLDQVALEKIAGRAAAQAYWQIAQEAKALVRDLIAAHDMPVTFRPGIAHACWHGSELRDTHAYAEKLHRDYGYDQIEPLDQAGIRALVGSPAYKGGEIDWGAGHIHPLNFAVGLARAALAAGAVIHENSLVTSIDRGAQVRLRTAAGSVLADQVILACNGYLGDLVPEVAAKVMPINNFMLATEPLGDRAAGVLSRPVAVHDTKFVVNYWRLSDDNRLLFGGGESYGWRFPDLVQTVMKPMLQVYPQLAGVPVTHAWGGTLAITLNRLPCFTRVTGNILSASGYSGHGVALATLAGKLMAEAARGQTERFDLMAALPQPRFPGGVALRWPLLVLAMTWFSLRDRLGL